MTDVVLTPIASAQKKTQPQTLQRRAPPGLHRVFRELLQPSRSSRVRCVAEKAAVIPDLRTRPRQVHEGDDGQRRRRTTSCSPCGCRKSLADRVDEARGETPRSQWLRALVEREVGDAEDA